MEQIRAMLEEAKATICKSQEDMAQYYNQHHTSALVFNSGNKVYLDTIDIYTMHPSVKLSH